MDGVGGEEGNIISFLKVRENSEVSPQRELWEVNKVCKQNEYLMVFSQPP